MAADLGPVITKIQNTEGTIESATAWILASGERLKAAVAAALANGATAEQLAPVIAEVDVQSAKADALAAAIAANP